MTRFLYTAEQSREIDRVAIEQQGIAGTELMRRAADAVWQLIQEQYPSISQAVICAGGGNNAGDGYLVAERMRAAGWQVRVVALVPPTRLRGDAQAAWKQAEHTGVPVFTPDQATPICEELVLDALLGTGLKREPEGEWAQWIERINAVSATRVSIDLPSGLFADTGQASAQTVRADHTVTLITRKQGLYTADGPEFAGHIAYRSLDVDLDSFHSKCCLMDWDEFVPSLPVRLRNTHKGHYGHVLVVGGCSGYQGAAELCAVAALRCGSGLVSLVHPPGAAAGRAPLPELMCHAVAGRVALRNLARRADVIAIGPGLGQDAWAQDMLGEVLDLSQPLVVDADALRLLAREPRQRADWVLTPHPGEAGALLDQSSVEVQRDRFVVASQLVKQTGGVVVLKGCGTVVATTERADVCADGNPGMATAGMGDVLTGVIASWLGQGLEPAVAARLGVCLHARAGDRAAEAGARGLIASDLLANLRSLLGS